MTSTKSFAGVVTVMAWYSNETYVFEGSSGENVHLSEISRPVPPPRPVRRGVWENVKLVESAAGVAVFSGVIQVSVRARISKERWLAKPSMNSVLLTADRQFHKPMEKVLVGEDCLSCLRLLRFLLLLAQCRFLRWLGVTSM